MSLNKNFVLVSGMVLFLIYFLIPDFCIASIWEEGFSFSLTPRPFSIDGLKNSILDLDGIWKFNPSPK